MGYAPLSDSFHSHVKFQRLGADWDAVALWTVTLSWATQHGTDGEVPHEVAEKFAKRKTRRMVRALLRVGLWERSRGGYRFHDFLDWQKSSKELRDLREKKRMAGS